MSRRKKKGIGIHAHACTSCGQRYEDACRTTVQGPRGGLKEVPGADGVCPSCQMGRPIWNPEAWLPKDCCRAHSRVARPEEIDKYRLAGRGPWFICTVCARTHPLKDPTLTKEKA